MPDLICNRCGHRNAVDANFCSSCGAPLEAPADEHPTAAIELDMPAGDEDEGIDTGGLTGAMFVVRSGPNAGSRFAVDKDLLTAGRHPDSDIFLDDITVSRRHVEVIRRVDGYVVRDVGSLNGTYVNRERIDEAPLHVGDEVQVGKYKLVFLDGAEA